MKAMWPHAPSSTKIQNNKKLLPNSKMLTTSIALIVLAIIVEANTLVVPGYVPEVSNGVTGQHIVTNHSSPISSLSDKYNEFEKMYGPTLMNSTLLPFVDDCKNEISKSVLKLKAKERFLCFIYFDMINNLIHSANPDFTQTENVKKSLNDYDNEKLVTNFCTFFGGELPTEDDKRPFIREMLANQSNEWLIAVEKPEKCNLLCYDIDDPKTVRIKPICKLISGGYRLINNKQLQSASNVDKKIAASVQMQPNSTQKTAAKIVPSNATVPAIINEVKAKPASATGSNTSASNTDVKNENKISANGSNNSTKPLEEATKNTKTLEKAPEKVAQQLESADKPQNENVPLHNAETKPDGENEENKENPLLLDNEDDKDNIGDDDTENAGAVDEDADDADGDNQPVDVFRNQKPKYVNERTKNKETQQKPNENNLSDENNNVSSDALFDDTDSNFFSYLMFLMLITIIFYIVYHNKTKVLALVIEGRRDRSGYSRNGSRRKHHSAEYRKLDSNLEEAIQSNDQVHTTQIIY